MRRPRLTRRRSIAAGALAMAGAAVAIVLGVGFSGDGASSAGTGSTATATTTIARRDLVEMDTESGTLGYADSRTVVNRLSGTITWLPESGSKVAVDHALFKVDDEPVILFDGTVPAYRALQSGVSDGPDVRQLERNLHALGYDASQPITVDRSWDAATTAAVRRWQDAHGLEVTGNVELGRVAFQPGTRRIGEVEADLGGSGSGSGSGSNATGASYDPSSELHTQFASLQTGDPPSSDADATPPASEDSDAQPTTPSKPKAKSTPQAKTPSSTPSPAAAAAAPSGSGSGSEGSSGGSGSSVATTVMTTTSTRRQVTVDLPTSKQSVAKAGARVTVELPSGGDVPGRIASIGRVATTDSSDSGSDSGANGSGSGSGTATVGVTIRLTGKTGSTLDQAPVSVHFQASRAKDVLAIPVTALLARPGNTYAVEVVQGSERRLVPVTPGIYTSGYVEIEGDGIDPGMRVTNAAE